MGAYAPPAGGWRIHNYKKPEGILLGFEYELDTESPEIRLLLSTLPKHYSFAHENICLNTYGYEIKSSVAPLRTIKQEIRQLSNIFNFPIRSINHGGIHINISRTEYTNKHINKVCSFLHNPNNRSWLLVLSGRDARSFDLYSPCHGQSNWHQYYGILTTRKSYAYEFRMFKAKPELLIPAAEFIHALFDLAESVEQLTTDNIQKHLDEYDRYRSIRTLYADAISIHRPSS